MKNNRSKKRILLAEIACVIGCLLFSTFLCGKYLLLATFDDGYHGTKNTITYQTIEDFVVEGDIYDRDGALILVLSSIRSRPSYYSFADFNQKIVKLHSINIFHLAGQTLHSTNADVLFRTGTLEQGYIFRRIKRYTIIPETKKPSVFQMLHFDINAVGLIISKTILQDVITHLLHYKL